MLSGISIWQLLILLVIVVLIFGTKRLRNLGGDLGSALKDFRGAMKNQEHDDESGDEAHKHSDDPQVIDQPKTAKSSTGPVEEAQRRSAHQDESGKHE